MRSKRFMVGHVVIKAINVMSKNNIIVCVCVWGCGFSDLIGRGCAVDISGPIPMFRGNFPKIDTHA